jgi:hypothetical protein
MSVENIKIIKNFITPEDAQRVIAYINKSTSSAVDWLSDGSTPNFVYRPDRWYKRRMGLDDLMPNYSPERSISALGEVEGLIKRIVEESKEAIGKAFNDPDRCAFKEGFVIFLGAKPHIPKPHIPLIPQTSHIVKPYMHGLGIIYQTLVFVKPILCIKKSPKIRRNCR